MKNLKFILCFILASLFINNGCQKDELIFNGNQLQGKLNYISSWKANQKKFFNLENTIISKKGLISTQTKSRTSGALLFPNLHLFEFTTN